MKQLSVILVLTLVLFTSCKEDLSYQKTDYTRGDAIFNIKIEDPNNSFVKIKSYELYQHLDLDDKGRLIDTLKNITEGYYTFSDKRHASGLYLKPGAKVNVKLNTRDFIKTIEFSGDLVNENNFMTQYFILNRDISRMNAIQHLAYLKEDAFKKTIDSVKQFRDELLVNYNKKSPLDKHFKYLQEQMFFYEWANRMETYEDYHKYAAEDPDFKVSEGYYIFRDKVEFSNENLMVIPAYHYYLENYYQKEANKLTEIDSSDVFVNFLKVVGTKVDNTIIKERLLHSYTVQNLKNTGNQALLYETFNKYATDEKHKKEVREQFTELNRLNPGNKSPNFKLKNDKGEWVSLADFKGSYVYIDVWASWCTPCIKEMPALEKLKEMYKDRKLVFIGISTDSFEGTWKRFLAKNKPKGVQLFAGDDNNFKDLFKAHNVPKFLIINPEGNIVTAVAPRPTEKETITMLFDRIPKKE